MTTFSVLGIPLACDTRTGGMAEAPAAWRQAGVMDTLAPLGGVDQGNVFATAIIGKDQTAFQSCSDQTMTALARIETPVVLLGGDCTIAPGVMAAVASRQPMLVWLDAHGDFNTIDPTPSGYWPGMPLARVAGLVTPLGPAEPILPGSDIVLVGARDLDPGEGENALGIGAT